MSGGKGADLPADWLKIHISRNRMMGGNDQFQTWLCDSGAFACPQRPRLLIDAIRPRPLINAIRPHPLIDYIRPRPLLMASGHALSSMLMLPLLPPVSVLQPELPISPPPPLCRHLLSRSTYLSCCLWCVCSSTWLDSSSAAREPSWFPV